MKIFTLGLLALLVSACASNKSTSTTDAGMNETLLNGEWQANYVSGTEKPFDELFPEMAPFITFNLEEGRVSGMSGCNNFTGSFSTEGNKLSFGDNMALTRKMCPDMTGEDAFISTLQKVDSYSVSEGGETLNLIMGDIAIMRLVRK